MNLGRGRPRLKIAYFDLRDDFRVYLSRYSPETAQRIESYLNRFLSGKEINGPIDVARLFEGLSAGQVHQLDRALRAFLNYCLLKGYPEDWIKLLKKAIPKEPEFIDLRVPEEHEVIESLKQIEFIPLKYKALWVLCLESGLRLIEAVNMIKNFDGSKLIAVNGFYRYQIGAFRGSKAAYFAYFTGESLKLINEARNEGSPIKRANASHYFSKYKILQPKYLRKFAFDKMVELGIPESIADFIQGRTPVKVCAKHYMSLEKQAAQYYMRYVEYLKQLREKAKI
ncbi:MAG: integrase [Candidatus Bathyarchaeia archaeon]